MPEIVHLLGEIHILILTRSIKPKKAAAYPKAVDAINNADILVLGPGSLYTSVLPNLMVPGISSAINSSNSTKIYVCNVATEIGETGGFTVSDHVKALQNHTNQAIVEWIAANNNITDIGSDFRGESVKLPDEKIGQTKVVIRDVLDVDHPVRHDPDKLAALILEIHSKGSKNSNRWS